MQKPSVFQLFLFAALSLGSSALAAPFSIEVDPAGVARKHAPVVAELKVPAQVSEDEAKAYAANTYKLTPGDALFQTELVKDTDGKITAVRLHWVEAALAADKKVTYRVVPDDRRIKRSAFAIIDAETHRDLQYGNRNVWRHFSLKYDAKDHVNTFKHFHHINTFDGAGYITQATGGKQFPHHRGLFMGFAKTQAGGKSYDTWHGSAGVSVRHESFNKPRDMAGTVAARSASVAQWCTGEGKPIVIEEREVTTWLAGEGALILDFDITLKAPQGVGDVILGGDPQHAGFQFRAAGEVGEGKAKYVYPQSATGGKNDVWEKCLWVAGQFTIAGKPYIVAHFDHPANPDSDKSVYSTRNYGRFGPFAQHTLKPDAPLTFHYRILILDGAAHTDVSADHFENLHQGFVKPVKVTVGAG